MLNKKYKLYSSILALCMTLALMATGVWAILQQSVGVSTTVSFTATSVKGTINGEVEGGYAGITTDYEPPALGDALTGGEIVQFGTKYVFANITGTNSSWNGKEAYYVNEEETTEKVGTEVTTLTEGASYTVSKKSYVSNFSPTSPTTNWSIADMVFQPNAEGQTSAITITLTIQNTGSNIIAVSFPDDLRSAAMSETTAPNDNLLVSYAISNNGSAFSEPVAFSTINSKSIVSGGITTIKILVTVQDDSSSISPINLAFQVKLEKGVDVWSGETALAFAGGSGEESTPFLIENGDQLEYLSTLARDDNPYYYKLTNNIILNNASFAFKEASGLVEVKNRDRTLYLGTALEPTGSVTFSTGTKSVAGTVYTLEESVYTEWTTVTADTGLIAIGTDLYVGTGTVGDTTSTNTQFDGTASISGQFYSLDAGTYTPSFLNVWNSIGNGMDGPLLNKVFDGKGYEVSGLYINTSSGYNGLFGFINNTTIKNIEVVNSYIKGGGNVGGILGFGQGVTIDNCSNSASVLGAGIGGIIGMVPSISCSISNCCNTGVISGTSDTGGIAGNIPLENASITNCYNMGIVYENGRGGVGGITGSMQTCTISNCYNYGNISVDNVDSVGGIAGMIIGTISNCHNYGNITGSAYGMSGVVGGVVGRISSSGSINNCHNSGFISGDGGYIAGVAGFNSASSMINCYNDGTINVITSASYIGGVFAYCSGGVMNNCYNTGDVIGGTSIANYIAGVVGLFSGSTSSATNCYNTAKIVGISTNIAGVFGQSNSDLVSNCYNTGNITGNSGYYYVAGVVGYFNGTLAIDCYNSGTILGILNNNNGNIGGVFALSSSDTSVTNCYNFGIVGGSANNIGGIIGVNSGLLKNCYNRKNVSGTADNIGGIVGYNGNTVINTFNIGTVTGSGTVGGVAGCNRADVGNVSYSYYLVGSATNAIGSDLGTSTYLSSFDSSDKLLNSEVTVDATYSANSTTLLTVLNAWVTQNQTTPAYKTWTLNNSITGYPVFA